MLMPMTAPLASTSAPPELPGLIGASVWTALMTALVSLPSPASRTGRSRALTMPVVTVPARPSGEPMATTGSPTTTSSGAARGRRCTRPGFSTLRTARSLAGSRPTMRAAEPLPSEKTARISAPSIAVGAGDDVVVGDDVAVVALDDDAGAGRPDLADPHLDRDHGRA